MSGYIPLPSGKTVAINATTTSSSVYLDVGTSNSVVNVLITNADPTNVAFVNWNATGASTATTANFPVPPYYPTVLQINSPNNFDSNVTISAITATGTATIYVTPVVYLG